MCIRDSPNPARHFVAQLIKARRDAPKDPTSTTDFIAVPTSSRFAVLQEQDEDKEESEDRDIVVCTDIHVAADESIHIPNSTNIPSEKDRADSSCREQLNGKSLQPPVNSWQSAESAPASPTSLLETPWSPVSSLT